MTQTSKFARNTEFKLFTDNFAGGGGASEGIYRALRRQVDIAVNHNPAALAMHGVNHPRTRHYCENVFNVKPAEVTYGRSVGAGWFSPDCTHFSIARTGAPKSARVRGLAWIVLRWLVESDMEVFFLENVKEFPTWGPVDAKGRVIEEHRGRTYRAFIDCLTTGISPDHPDVPEIMEALGEDFPMHRLYAGLGLTVETKEIRAYKFGAPTIRNRFFLIGRRDGRPIVWPEPTHDDPASEEVKSGKRKPWRTAAECIDFSLPCHSIFLTKADVKARKLRIKRPLAKASCRRLALGTKRYVMDAETPFIVNLTHGGREESTDEPFRTITGANRGEKALADAQLAAPFITEHANASNQRNFPADEPLRTQCAKVKGGHFAEVEVSLAAPTSAYVPTMIQTGYGEREGQEPRTLDINKPLGTAVAGAVKHAVGAVYLARQFGTAIGRPVDEPAPTVMSGGGGGKSEVVMSFLAQHNTGVVGHTADEPFSTLTGTCSHQQLVAVSCVAYYGTDQDPRIEEPLPTATTKHRFGVSEASLAVPVLTPELAVMARRTAAFLREHGVEFDGEFATTRSGLIIVDIGMRMFTPRELFLAQGFPPDYIIDRGVDPVTGEEIKLSITEQVHMCGNSVCPDVADALVSANVPYMRAPYSDETEDQIAA